MTKRTARSDCNYIIYSASHNGQSYIGLTRKGSVSVAKAVKERWRKHISRARHEAREWALYKYICAGAWDGWEHSVIDIVRAEQRPMHTSASLSSTYSPSLMTSTFEGSLHFELTVWEECVIINTYTNTQGLKCLQTALLALN